MAKNLLTSREYKNYDNNNVKHRSNAATKKQWEAKLPVGSYVEGGKVYAYVFVL